MKYETRKEVAEKAANEGLGEFLLSYASPDNMPDDELKKAFLTAREAILLFEMLLPEVEEC